MKKQKLKIFLKLGILFFGISLFTVACEKDDLKIESTTTNSRYKTDMLSQKQIISNKQVKEKLERISPSIKNKTGNSALREIYIEAHNFTIETDSVKYVEDTYNNVHSYNFAISRDSTNSNHIENLLLTLNQDNEYDAYIVEYRFTKTELETLDKASLDERYVTLTPIDFDTSIFNENELSQKMIYTSEDGEMGYFCDQVLVNLNENCPCDPYYVWQDDCYWLPIVNPNSGGGDSQNNNNNPQDNSNPANNHGGIGGSIPHSPNTNCRTCPEVDEAYELTEEQADAEELISDCNVLNNLSSSPDFTPRMQELIANTTGNTEISYYGETNSSNVTSYPNDSDHRYESNPADGAVVDLPLPATAINSVIHNHFNDGTGSYSVFSHQDLSSFFSLYSNSTGSSSIQDLDNFTAIVVTPGPTASPNDDTVYAITISSATNFAAAAALYASNTKIMESEFIRLKISPDIATSLNEKRLAKLFKDRKMGLTLYRGDKNNLNSWTRIKAKNNGTVIDKNCNN